ncbi:sulfurtransferase TusA family protein [Colwellia sp. MB02u-9]|uniref:sulfurtransferase TusA family protein n=1 Tax=Colwellia sp. MB02u-9 TaxID=2759823 RepID=UPI0015F48823|nr:sulfurtransferase TusA family protein [Colwellia sp. MB02u-9]MBA6297146.1 sulfurtransferase TusA family protein [Colwellia sp. MB02u-9]
MIYEYDATQDKCPVPLVNLRLLLRKLTPIDRCLIRIYDNGSKKDIPKLLTKQGFYFEQRNIDKYIVELIIRMEK